ncbi:MAG: hypothetical protein HC904_03190 [Blastochloris sp.]|nr:hypothetical protein [Blastochloris sp.]
MVGTLSLGLKIFYGIGILSTLVLAILTILSLVGGQHQEDFSELTAEHPDDFGLISIRTVTAFFLGFGWVGAITLNQGGGLPLALILGTVSGAVFMAIIYSLMLGMSKMQSSGYSVSKKPSESLVRFMSAYLPTRPALGRWKSCGRAASPWRKP